MATKSDKAAAFRAAMVLESAKRERLATTRFLEHAKMFEAGAVERALAGDLGDGNVQVLAEAEAWDRMEEARRCREFLRTHHELVAIAHGDFILAADIARNVDSE